MQCDNSCLALVAVIASTLNSPVRAISVVQAAIYVVFSVYKICVGASVLVLTVQSLKVLATLDGDA